MTIFKNLSMAMMAVLLSAGAAYALSLDEARSSGLVGERPDGYVGVVSSTPDAEQLASSVNAARKEEYQKIAAKNGQAIDVVEKLAAAKIFQNIPGGTFVLGANGQWAKK